MLFRSCHRNLADQRLVLEVEEILCWLNSPPLAEYGIAEANLAADTVQEGKSGVVEVVGTMA